MSVEARLWREVCLHLDLDESVQRVLAVMRDEGVPADGLVVRRIDGDTLTTVAFDGDAEGVGAARTVLDARGRSAVAALLEDGRADAAPRGGALARAVLPAAESELVVVPLRRDGAAIGVAVFLLGTGAERHVTLLATAARPLGVAYENDRRLHDLSRLQAALEADRDALLTRLQRQEISEEIIGAEAGLAGVIERVEQVARTDVPVLVLGETGSGKEVVARAIHARSTRARGPVVRVNCGAIPPELVDSELFGHERGSFTGATASRQGWFERADGGTLFLDEIGELPAAAQVRLLRVLQDGTLERVGGERTIQVEVRVVAATHRHLEGMVAEGTFREDLWYRLSVFPIRLPALRERLEDLPALATHFAERAGRRLGGAPLRPGAADLALLREYPWPGNVRELAAVIERAAILGNGKRLELRAALGASTAPRVRPPESLDEIATLDEAMADHIRRALARAEGRIEGPGGAAEILAINPHTLRARMRKLGVDWARYRPGDAPLRR